MFRWQWHGRQAFTEVRNDFRFSRSLHRVVYHLDDFCKAANEESARAIFLREYPDAQELGIYCIGPTEDDSGEMMNQPELAL